ncbi:hypothetical protein B0O99DRAFT_684850 [Bisporella sp. PMI_857]|nr:hypothetical protein B0O99DRAFT_684850 [Bisporella sp. PMI_857]
MFSFSQRFGRQVPGRSPSPSSHPRMLSNSDEKDGNGDPPRNKFSFSPHDLDITWPEREGQYPAFKSRGQHWQELQSTVRAQRRSNVGRRHSASEDELNDDKLNLPTAPRDNTNSISVHNKESISLREWGSRLDGSRCSSRTISPTPYPPSPSKASQFESLHRNLHQYGELTEPNYVGGSRKKGGGKIDGFDSGEGHEMLAGEDKKKENDYIREAAAKAAEERRNKEKKRGRPKLRNRLGAIGKRELR